MRPKMKVAPHGSRSRYTSYKHRCRCAACTRANADYMRPWMRAYNAGLRDPHAR